VALIVVLIRTLAAESILERIGCGEAVDSSLSGKNAGFALVVVVGDLSPELKAAADANHRTDSIIGYVFAVLQAARRICKVPAEIRVGREHCGGGATQRHEPVGVRQAQVFRSDEDCFLIFGNVLQQAQS
jgi:hypothetical protein